MPPHSPNKQVSSSKSRKSKKKPKAQNVSSEEQRLQDNHGASRSQPIPIPVYSRKIRQYDTEYTPTFSSPLFSSLITSSSPPTSVSSSNFYSPPRSQTRKSSAPRSSQPQTTAQPPAKPVVSTSFPRSISLKILNKDLPPTPKSIKHSSLPLPRPLADTQTRPQSPVFSSFFRSHIPSSPKEPQSSPKSSPKLTPELDLHGLRGLVTVSNVPSGLSTLWAKRTKIRREVKISVENAASSYKLCEKDPTLQALEQYHSSTVGFLAVLLNSLPERDSVLSGDDMRLISTFSDLRGLLSDSSSFSKNEKFFTLLFIDRTYRTILDILNRVVGLLAAKEKLKPGNYVHSGIGTLNRSSLYDRFEDVLGEGPVPSAQNGANPVSSKRSLTSLSKFSLRNSAAKNDGRNSSTESLSSISSTVSDVPSLAEDREGHFNFQRRSSLDASKKESISFKEATYVLDQWRKLVPSKNDSTKSDEVTLAPEDTNWIKYGSNGKIVWMSRSAIFDKMIQFESCSFDSEKENLRSALFLNFRHWSKPDEFLEYIVNQYKYDSQKPKGRNLTLLVVIKDWLEMYWDEKEDKSILGRLRAFLDRIKNTEHWAVKKIWIKLKEYETPFTRRSSRKREGKGSNKNLSRASQSLEDDPGVDLLDIDCEKFACQLTLMEEELYSAIDPKEFVWHSIGLPVKDNKIQERREAQCNFSNKLSRWVKFTVLDRKNIDTRNKVYKYLLNVATTCASLRNFNSAFSIGSALEAINPKKIEIRIDSDMTNQLSYLVNDCKKVQESNGVPTIPCMPSISGRLARIKGTKEWHKFSVLEDRNEAVENGKNMGKKVEMIELYSMLVFCPMTRIYNSMVSDQSPFPLTLDECIQRCINKLLIATPEERKLDDLLKEAKISSLMKVTKKEEATRKKASILKRSTSL